MGLEVGEVLRGLGALAVAILAVAFVTPLAWLAGLVISLRGSKPCERPDILRAYGHAQPRRVTERLRGRSRR
jgi:hypothetical protein